MEKIQGFCDLCVPYNKNHQELIELLNEHIECKSKSFLVPTNSKNYLIPVGYKNVAIEQIYDDIEAKKPEKGKRPSDHFPVPVSLKFLEEVKFFLLFLCFPLFYIIFFQKFDGKLKFFTRLTIIYAEQGITHPMVRHFLNSSKFEINRFHFNFSLNPKT